MGVLKALSTGQDGRDDGGGSFSWFGATANVNDGSDTTFETTGVVEKARNVGAPFAMIESTDYTGLFPDGDTVLLRWKWKVEWWDLNDSSPLDFIEMTARYRIGGGGDVVVDTQNFSTATEDRAGSAEGTITQSVTVPDATLLRVKVQAAWRATSGVDADAPPDLDTILPDIKVTVFACEVVVPSFVGGMLL